MFVAVVLVHGISSGEMDAQNGAEVGRSRGVTANQSGVPFRIRAAMTPKFPGFSPEAVKFLRNLAKNNKREWFQPRKQQYDELIKLLMVQLVECLNSEFA